MKERNSKVNLIRVVLAHGQSLVSEGTSALLENVDGIEVVGLAANAGDLLDNLKLGEPDVVLLDVLLPGLADLDGLRIARDYPQVRMILLTGSGSARGPVSLRVAGYISKNTSFSEVVLAIRSVASSGAYTAQEIDGNQLNSQVKKLSPRQTEVLRMIALGHSTKQIGRLLGISAKTVETHRAQIIEKLDIRTLAGLVRYAIAIQLVDLEISSSGI